VVVELLLATSPSLEVLDKLEALMLVSLPEPLLLPTLEELLV
jgi:hypothetical protein